MDDCIMENNPRGSKQLVIIGKVGPAFSLHELTAAHESLDRAGAPRERIRGGEREILSLGERIAWLHGQLVSARLAQPFVRTYIRRNRRV